MMAIFDTRKKPYHWHVCISCLHKISYMNMNRLFLLECRLNLFRCISIWPLTVFVLFWILLISLSVSEIKFVGNSNFVTDYDRRIRFEWIKSSKFLSHLYLFTSSQASCNIATKMHRFFNSFTRERKISKCSAWNTMVCYQVHQCIITVVEGDCVSGALFLKSSILMTITPKCCSHQPLTCLHSGTAHKLFERPRTRHA